MANTGILASRLDGAFADAKKRIEDFHEGAKQSFEELQQRYEEFEALRRHIREDIGMPRLEQLLARFEGVETKPTTHRHGGELEVSFLNTPDCPARITLKFGLSHDQQIGMLFLDYELEVLPVFVKFERHSRLEVPIDAPDDDAIAAWFDDRLVSFAETYLQLQFTDQYQEGQMVTDPVINIRFPKTFAKATSEYTGHSYYFATDESKQAFDQESDEIRRGLGDLRDRH